MQKSRTLKGSFLNQGLFDHRPNLFSKQAEATLRAPFRYSNVWARVQDFFKIVSSAWAIEVCESPMFKVLNKLSNVKKALVKWHQTKLPVSEAKENLEAIQSIITQISWTVRLFLLNKRLQIISRDSFSLRRIC